MFSIIIGLEDHIVIDQQWTDKNKFEGFRYYTSMPTELLLYYVFREIGTANIPKSVVSKYEYTPSNDPLQTPQAQSRAFLYRSFCRSPKNSKNQA